MISIDIPADLNGEDETGLVWTFLDEAADPGPIVPGAIVVAGDAHASAVAEGPTGQTDLPPATVTGAPRTQRR